MSAPLLHSPGSAVHLDVWFKIPQSEWWLHLTWDRGDGHTQFTGTTMSSVGSEYYHPLCQVTWLCDTTLQGQEFYHNRIMVWGACTRGVCLVEENPGSKCVEPEASLCKIVSRSNVKRKKNYRGISTVNTNIILFALTLWYLSVSFQDLEFVAISCYHSK